MEIKTILDNKEYLRQISEPVDFSKDDWKESITKLAKFCENNELCLALASIQIGIPLRIIYLKKTDLARLNEDYNESTILINPRVLKQEGLTTYWEACASCLNNAGLVERPYKLLLEYYDINGNKHEDEYVGFPATVISHELDHLDGILHIDIALKILDLPPEERKKLREKEPYKIIRKDGVYIHPINKK